MFVFVVVLAFGETYKVSAINQMLATAAGGIVPFILRNFVFRSRVSASVDTDNIQFKTNIAEQMKNYSSSWPVHDITAKKR